MEKKHFTIYPFQGFGLLRFGQSVAEAKKFVNIYGDIEAETLPMTEEYLDYLDESLISASNIRLKTPLADQSLNRLNIVFHLQKISGRSRQGLPV